MWRRSRCRPIWPTCGSKRSMSTAAALVISFADGRLATIDRSDQLQMRQRTRRRGHPRDVPGSGGLIWLGGTEGVTRFDGSHFATPRGTESLCPSRSEHRRRSGAPCGSARSHATRAKTSRPPSKTRRPRSGTLLRFIGRSPDPRCSAQSAVRDPMVASVHEPRCRYILIRLRARSRAQGACPGGGGDCQRAVPEPVMQARRRTERPRVRLHRADAHHPARRASRYRLEGSTRRVPPVQAAGAYTGVPPGSSRFQVMAATARATGVSAAELARRRTGVLSHVVVLRDSRARRSASWATTWRLHLICLRRQFFACRTPSSAAIHDTLLQSLVASHCSARRSRGD
jgi:hypothetical protein